jgi:hypothetical protein
MKVTAHIVLLGIAGALFLVATIGLEFGLNLVALGLLFVTAALVAERMRVAT